MTKAEGFSVTDEVFNEKKEVSIRLLRAFEGRVKWRFFFDKIVPADKLPKSRGYPALIEKIKSYENNLVGNMVVDNVISLKEKLITHCLAGEKSVKLFKVPDAGEFTPLFCSLERDLASVDNADSIYQQDESDFKATPQLYSIKKITSGYYLLFLSVRTVKSREDIPLSAVSDEFKDMVPTGSKLYCVSNQKKVCCDAVFISTNDPIVEFRVDNSVSFNAEERNNAHINLMLAFQDYCIKSVGNKLNGRHLDFFPLIRQVLNYSVGDGRVIELKFMTAKGASKQHKGKDSPDGCILIDEYHLAGAEKINNAYDPYMISRVWDVAQDDCVSSPQLTLPGNMRMLSCVSQAGILQEVLITDAVDESDYRFVINKLVSLI